MSVRVPGLEELWYFGRTSDDTGPVLEPGDLVEADLRGSSEPDGRSVVQPVDLLDAEGRGFHMTVRRAHIAEDGCASEALQANDPSHLVDPVWRMYLRTLDDDVPPRLTIDRIALGGVELNDLRIGSPASPT